MRWDEKKHIRILILLTNLPSIIISSWIISYIILIKNNYNHTLYIKYVTTPKYVLVSCSICFRPTYRGTFIYKHYLCYVNVPFNLKFHHYIYIIYIYILLFQLRCYNFSLLQIIVHNLKHCIRIWSLEQ